MTKANQMPLKHPQLIRQNQERRQHQVKAFPCHQHCPLCPLHQDSLCFLSPLSRVVRHTEYHPQGFHHHLQEAFLPTCHLDFILIQWVYLLEGDPQGHLLTCPQGHLVLHEEFITLHRIRCGWVRELRASFG